LYVSYRACSCLMGACNFFQFVCRLLTGPEWYIIIISIRELLLCQHVLHRLYLKQLLNLLLGPHTYLNDSKHNMICCYMGFIGDVIWLGWISLTYTGCHNGPRNIHTWRSPEQIQNPGPAPRCLQLPYQEIFDVPRQLFFLVRHKKLYFYYFTFRQMLFIILDDCIV
jgi:hypothetical protein